MPAVCTPYVYIIYMGYRGSPRACLPASPPLLTPLPTQILQQTREKTLHTQPSRHKAADLGSGLGVPDLQEAVLRPAHKPLPIRRYRD